MTDTATRFAVHGYGGGTVDVLVDGDYDGEYLSLLPWREMPNGYIALSGDFKWTVHDDHTGEVVGWERPVSQYLHQWVLPPLKGFWITHKNGDKLDNRLINLEYIRPSDTAAIRPMGSRIGNPKNSRYSKYRGVQRMSSGQYLYERWVAVCAGKHVGVFDTEKDAAHAYDIAATARWADRAQLNFRKGESDGGDQVHPQA